ERGRGGDHLERRSGNEETRARAVEKRGRRPAVGGDARDLLEARLDEVRVEARRGRHHEQPSVTRVEGDDRAALRAQLLSRGLLCIQVQVEDDVVPLDRLALELVDRAVEEGREVRVR